MSGPLELAARVEGNGPPLLILHGLFGSGRNWGGIARRLIDRYQVHLLDARNHGSSPWDGSMTYPELAADVAAYIERHKLAPLDLIGHSMGGKTAMRLALSRPELLRRLIVVDIAPVPYRGGAQDPYRGYIDAMRAIDLKTIHRRSEADAALASAIPDVSLRSFLVQNLEIDGNLYRWRINLDGIEVNLDNLTAFPAGDEHYDGPVTVIAGELSNYVKPRDEATIHKFFPHSRVEVIDGAGHWPHADQPDRLMKLLNEALAR